MLTYQRSPYICVLCNLIHVDIMLCLFIFEFLPYVMHNSLNKVIMHIQSDSD